MGSEGRTSSGPPGPSEPLCSSLQQMRGSAGCEMDVVIAPRPPGLQPIHGPVSALIEPAQTEATATDRPAVTLFRGPVSREDQSGEGCDSSSLLAAVSEGGWLNFNHSRRNQRNNHTDIRPHDTLLQQQTTKHGKRYTWVNDQHVSPLTWFGCLEANCWAISLPEPH